MVLGVSPQRVRALARSGELPGLRMGATPRQPEDTRRDQDGQCNALGIGRTGLRETTITAAARTRL